MVADSTRTVGESGRQEKVRDVDLQRFGVHRAHVHLDYVHRNAEADLLTLLSAGAPVLVVGHSMAGKTRMTAQVLREHLGDRPILLPTPPDGLSRLAAHGAQPQGSVVGSTTSTAISLVRASGSSGSTACASAAT